MKHTKSMIYKPTVESNELYLFAANTGSLYRQSITPLINSLKRKVKKGTYDRAKAVDAWYYIATAASDLYNRDFGYRFDVTARYTAAVELAEFFEDEIFFEG